MFAAVVLVGLWAALNTLLSILGWLRRPVAWLSPWSSADVKRGVRARVYDPVRERALVPMYERTIKPVRVRLAEVREAIVARIPLPSALRRDDESEQDENEFVYPHAESDD
jgi:hypothetical protein